MSTGSQSEPPLAESQRPICTGCVADGLFALPLLMTGEKVRDIGVAAGVGQWAKQGVNGVRDLEGAGGGDWRPTQRMPPARAPLNHVPTVVPRRRRRAVRLTAGAGGVDVRADMMTTRIGAVRLAAARGDSAAELGASTVVSSQRLSRNEWGYAGKRSLDKAFLLPGDPGICRKWRPGLRLCIRCSALLM